MLDKVKKRLESFFLEEEGACSKKGIFAMGILSFALSATSVNSAKWVDIKDTGKSVDSAKYNVDCVGTDSKYSNNVLTGKIQMTMSSSSEGTRTFNLEYPRSLLVEAGILDPMPPGYSSVTPSEEMVSIKAWDHLSGGPCCHVSDHFSTTDNNGNPKIEFEVETEHSHLNELTIEESEGVVLIAQHSHDIETSSEGTELAHFSDHWDGNKDCNSHDSSHINNGDNVGWFGDCDKN